MGKRAADGTSRGTGWFFLERIDSELATAICAIYSNPLQFDGAFDTMDEAAEMARGLGAWKQRGGLSPSIARQLSDGMDSQPAAGARIRPDPGAIYT